uniref:MARVEL domain-containing protein n=1 Tax=Dracunculus medinensis TaxID=318479 RepID=A0A0N4UCE4_DRAME
LIGFIAIFASSFIWNQSNVYFQLGYRGFGWQTLILAVLIVTWFLSLIILFSQFADRDILVNLGKYKVLCLYACCCVALFIAACLESWYCKLAYGDPILHPRFVVVTVSCCL